MPPKLSPLTSKKEAHKEGIWACAWGSSASGSALVTGGADETVAVWGVGADGALSQRLRLTGDGLTLGVAAVAASPAGHVAASSMHSRISVFDGASEHVRIDAGPGEVWGIAFEPGDAPRHLAAAAGVAYGASLWRVDAKNEGLDTPTAVYSLPKPVRAAPHFFPHSRAKGSGVKQWCPAERAPPTTGPLRSPALRRRMRTPPSGSRRASLSAARRLGHASQSAPWMALSEFSTPRLRASCAAWRRPPPTRMPPLPGPRTEPNRGG